MGMYSFEERRAKLCSCGLLSHIIFSHQILNFKPYLCSKP